MNYQDFAIQKLINERGWNRQSQLARARAIYTFVKDEILFGFNEGDAICASKVLNDGYGQCNTKATLLMALLRACRIPCRVHAFTIDKSIQKGIMKGITYKKAPVEIVHCWVEACVLGKWYVLEGVILDENYLTALHQSFQLVSGKFWGYGVGTNHLEGTNTDFNLNDTYIQAAGIKQALGIYENPDEMHNNISQKLSVLETVLYRILCRHLINRNIKRIRNNRSK